MFDIDGFATHERQTPLNRHTTTSLSKRWRCLCASFILVGGFALFLFGIAGCSSNSSPTDSSVRTEAEDEFTRLTQDVDSELRTATEHFIATMTDVNDLPTEYQLRFADNNVEQIQSEYTDHIRPALDKIHDTIDAYRKRHLTAIQPIVDLLELQQQELDYIKSTLTHIVIPSPREFGAGFQGRDSFSGRHVYIETTRYRPEQIGQTARLFAINSWFRRDGTVKGTNAFGAEISLPKYVDAPSEPIAMRNKLEDMLARYQADVQQAITLHTTTKREELQSSYNAMLDRSLALAMAKREAILQDALSELAAPDIDQFSQRILDGLSSLEWRPGIGSDLQSFLDTQFNDVDAIARDTTDRLTQQSRSLLAEYKASINQLELSAHSFADQHGAALAYRSISDGTAIAGMKSEFSRIRQQHSNHLRQAASKLVGSLLADRQHSIGLEHSTLPGRVDQWVVTEEYTYCVKYLGRRDRYDKSTEQLAILRFESGTLTDEIVFEIDDKHDGWGGVNPHAELRVIDGWMFVHHYNKLTIISPKGKRVGSYYLLSYQQDNDLIAASGDRAFFNGRTERWTSSGRPSPWGFWCVDQSGTVTRLTEKPVVEIASNGASVIAKFREKSSTYINQQLTSIQEYVIVNANTLETQVVRAVNLEEYPAPTAVTPISLVSLEITSNKLPVLVGDRSSIIEITASGNSGKITWCEMDDKSGTVIKNLSDLQSVNAISHDGWYFYGREYIGWIRAGPNGGDD